MSVSYDYRGRAVLVTGGSNGIGLAMAQGFAAAGAEVTVTGQRAAASDYDTDLSAFRYVSTRLEDDASVDALIAATDRLDVLVNNAGTAIRAPAAHTPEGFDLNVKINLSSVYRLTTGLIDKLAARPGCIVNIASMTTYVASPRVPGYGASKAAIAQLTQTMGALYADRGVRANAIAPGWISTNLTRPLENDEALSRPIIDRTPMGRWGRPAEVAAAALWLASDQASFVTGATLPVDGGYSSF